MTVLVKDWHWRSYLDMGLAYWLKSIILAVKYPCGVFLWKHGSQKFISFLLVGWVRYNYSLATVIGVAHGEDHGLESFGGTCLQV